MEAVTRPVVYIAGPFRSKHNPHGYNFWEQERNIRTAEAVALTVWELGGAAVCPHLNTAHFQGALPDDVWLAGDLDILRKCDVVVLTPGWNTSEGAQAEVQAARAWKIPVCGLECFEEWLRRWRGEKRYEADVSGNEITGP